MIEELKEILSSFKGKKNELIPILQHVQEKFGYLPEEVMMKVAEFLKISESQVYATATFFAQFRFTKPGKHLIKVCLGTACHVKGGEKLMDTVKRELNIENEDTTADHKFSVERVACIGCCALAPCIMIDETVHAKVTPNNIMEMLKSVEGEE